jgi:ketosteroid isomerase-like protein
MSRKNVEIVRRVYEASARRDSGSMLACYHPEVEWDISRAPYRALVGRGVYRGHDGLRSFFREYYEAWENVEDDVEELIDAGDHVVSVVVSRARGRASGAEVTRPQGAGVWTIRDGKVVRMVWFPTRADALEAAGLSE